MKKDIFFIRRKREDVPEEPSWDLVLAVAKMLEALGHEVVGQPMLSGVDVEEFIPIWQKNVARAPVSDWSFSIDL